MPISAGASTHPGALDHIVSDGPLASDPTQCTYPVSEADSGTPLETVTIEGWYSNVTNGGRTLTNQRAGTIQIPIPAGAVAADGGDAQLIVVDPLTGDEWGLSRAEQDVSGAWSAWNAYHYNTRWSSRLRLDPSLSAADLTSLGCTGHCLTIARALQKYGMYIIDNSGRSKVMLEYEGTAAWGGAVTQDTVSPIPLSAFKLLER